MMPQEEPRLIGETLILTPITSKDAKELCECLQDPRISETTSVPFPYTLDMARENLAESEEKWAKGSADFAIRSAADLALLGRIELIRSPRTPEACELAFFIRQDQWGKGFMTEAVGLALDYAFGHMGVERVEWRAHVGNWGSWKPVWRNGFTREGVRRCLEGPDQWTAALLKTDPRQPPSPWDGPGAGRGPALDPSQPQKLVEQFHRTYSMPMRLGTGNAPTIEYERIHMRMSLIQEEFAELMGAVYGADARSIVEAASERAVESDDCTRDLVETADALADLVYVIYGMAIESGIDLDKVLAEVQASNLSKLMPDGSVKLREDGKVLKGPGFFAPNIRRALGVDAEN